MERLPREIAQAVPWVSQARWFGESAADRMLLHDAAMIPPVPQAAESPDEPVWLAVVEAFSQGIDAKRFFLPLSCSPRPRTPDGCADAARHGRFVAWLLRAVVDGSTLAAGRGRFCGHASTSGDAAALPTGTLAIREIGVDASNTSLAVESAGRGGVIKGVVVKLVRRIRAGIHPEVEVGEFLAAAKVRADVPRLIGWLSYEPTAGEPTAGPSGDGGVLQGMPGGVAEPPSVLAVVHERIDAIGSAWDVMRDVAVNDWSRCLAMAASLGETTARLHAALASGDDATEFAPEPWTPGEWEDAVRRMALHAGNVIDRIDRRCAVMPPSVDDATAALVKRRAGVVNAFAAGRPPAQSVRIRVHGDYHLGQVLVGREADRCVVIDFEGEPGRPLAERREKTSAAKDVAGMCRSFDYLLRVLAKEGRRPYDPRDLASLESRFLDAYETGSRSLASAAGRRWWPEDRGEAARLLGLFKLDKAIYELGYEADHRPDWIDVPLGAITGLLGS